MTSKWDMTCDTLVVGSGAGGVCGAYTAAREGLEVILVEATEKFGGTSAFSGGGVWFPGNPVLERAGTDDTIEDALTYYTAVVGDSTPRELQETYIRGGGPLIGYLEQEEILEFAPYPWPDYYGNAPKARQDGMRHILPPPLPAAAAGELNSLIRGPLDTERLGSPLPDELIGGRSLIGRFLLAISKYDNASLQLNTTLIELVVEDHKVVGAIVESGGQRKAIGVRKGVLLAAGGFEQNDELRQRFGVPGVARDSMGSWANVGKALEAAIAVGADTDLMDQAWWSPGFTHPDGRSAFSLAITAGIFVDDAGERFVNESAPYDRLAREVIARMADGAVTLPYWLVYDNRNGVIPPVGVTNVSMVEPVKFQEAGLWQTADTLEELAEKIGVPAADLVATVQRYNEMSAKGADSDFQRGEEAYDRAFTEGRKPLTPIDQGPFHAAAFGISDLGTKGGLRTDTRARVLDAAGTPITGLYAAGNTMAAPSGPTYPGGGNPIGTSMLFAHLAAMDMVAVDQGLSRSDG